MAGQLIAWMQTADWGQSQTLLQEQAIQALLEAHDSQSFTQALQTHPILYQLPALAQLTTLIEQNQATAQPSLILHLLARLIPLLDIYNHEHNEQFHVNEQTQFIHLCERLLPITTTVGVSDLTIGLRQALVQALNMLGNHYAQQGEHQRAIETYTQAIAHEPRNAMVHRNRAGEYIEQQQYELAQADIEQAANLEPEAKRLPELWRDLYLGLGDGSRMLSYAQTLLARDSGEADNLYYLALAHALIGNLAAAETAMTSCSLICSDLQREEGLKSIGRLQHQHPEQATAWQMLETILQTKPDSHKESEP